MKDLMNSQFAFTIVITGSIHDIDDFGDDKRYLWIIAPTPEDFSLWFDGLRGLRSSILSLSDLTPFTEQQVRFISIHPSFSFSFSFSFGSCC